MPYFRIALISKYRTALMGIGILDVLFWHMATCYQLEGVSAQIVGTLTRSVFTSGFLFLSGFGIYFSYSNNPNKKLFYRRRFERLVIPFWVIVTIIFLLRLAISGVGDLPFYLGTLTTACYWIPGKTFNYWFIAVIFLFYIIYPHIHDFIFGKTERHSKQSVYIKVALICSILVLLNILLGNYYPYYKEIELAIPKLPMLFLGMLAGYLAKERDAKINMYSYCFILCILIFLYTLKEGNLYFDQYYYIIDKLLTIPILVLIFDFLEKKVLFFRRILPLLCWLGVYTLEIYVIHIYLMRVVSDFPQLPQTAEWWIAVPIALLICMPVQKLTKFITKAR